MIAIIDYDAGNLKSVEKALVFLGEKPVVTRDPKEILRADHVILPGVGSFGDAMENLKKFDLVHVIKEAADRKIPFLGICLGLQLLFEGSEETPGVEGLDILKGNILRIPAAEGLKIPHMGWNSLELSGDGRLFFFQGLRKIPYVFCSFLLLKAQGESIVKASILRHQNPCFSRKMCLHASSPGKKRGDRSSDSEKFCADRQGGSVDVYKKNHPMSGCKKWTGSKRH